MKNESLEKALDYIIENLIFLDIDPADRLELIMNLAKFLDKSHYDENIKTLNKVRRFTSR